MLFQKQPTVTKGKTAPGCLSWWGQAALHTSIPLPHYSCVKTHVAIFRVTISDNKEMVPPELAAKETYDCGN